MLAQRADRTTQRGYEEGRIFPRLRELGLFAPLLVMLREHGEICDAIDRIERGVDAEHPDPAYRCHQLLVQLQHHNAKEERIIYSQTDATIRSDEATEIVALLHSGELPAAWVCEGDPLMVTASAGTV